MNENKFKYNGVELKTEEININIECCKRCYFRYETFQECISLINRNKIPSCISLDRKDGKDVIFVEI